MVQHSNNKADCLWNDNKTFQVTYSLSAFVTWVAHESVRTISIANITAGWALSALYITVDVSISIVF